jgi:hypothetical protein
MDRPAKLLVGGGYLCRWEGIERKDAGENDLTLVETLAPAERADLAAMRSREGAFGRCLRG